MAPEHGEDAILPRASTEASSPRDSGGESREHGRPTSSTLSGIGLEEELGAYRER